MYDTKTKKIINILVKENLLKPDQLESLEKKAKEEKQSVEEYIYKHGIVKEEDFIRVKGKVLNIPYINLAGRKISHHILKEIPKEAASYYKFVPFAKNGNVLEIGMIDPTDVKALEALKFIAIRHKLVAKIYIISENSIEAVLKQYQILSVEIKKALKNIEEELRRRQTGKGKKEKEKIFEEAPVSKIVDIILKYAIEGKASDIHIEPTEKELVVRFRLDGILHNSLILPKRVHLAVISRIKVLSVLKIDEKRKPQDGRFHITFKGRGIDFRVSTLPTANGEKVAIRILDKSLSLQKLDGLGLSGKGHKEILKNIKKPFGMILITGPTGSGKSTTLYAILNILNQEGVNIITLEDPIEYFIRGVNQSQVFPEIGYTFASGLRSILRQDPDIIMVGEIRDKETAELAVHASLTGHIVLSTLHTNDAVGVVPRLVDMGIEPFLITSSLNVIIAQRLVRRICDHCKKEIVASPGIEKMILKKLDGISESEKKDIVLKNPLKIYKGEGCRYCNKSGYKGRIAIFEVLTIENELEEIIIKNPTEAAIREQARKQNMLTLSEDGILKVLKEYTTIEEVLRVTEESI